VTRLGNERPAVGGVDVQGTVRGDHPATGRAADRGPRCERRDLAVAIGSRGACAAAFQRLGATGRGKVVGAGIIVRSGLVAFHKSPKPESILESSARRRWWAAEQAGSDLRRPPGRSRPFPPGRLYDPPACVTRQEVSPAGGRVGGCPRSTSLAAAPARVDDGCVGAVEGERLAVFPSQLSERRRLGGVDPDRARDVRVRRV